jgi:hypothetical protein
MENFKKVKDLNLAQYLVLEFLVNNPNFFEDNSDEFCKIENILLSLETNNYIRIISNEEIVLTEKSKLLFKEEKWNKDLFEKFWEVYHQITGKPKTDKEAAIVKWKKLTPKEIQLALNPEIIISYTNNNELKYRKKARTYLGDKNFNDDYGIITPEINSREL